MTISGPGSVVGIATGYGLDGPGIEFRWGVRLSAPVQTGPRAQPASCTMGTESFPGVKCGRGVRPIQSLNACTRVHFTLLLCDYNINVATLLQNYKKNKKQTTPYGVSFVTVGLSFS